MTRPAGLRRWLLTAAVVLGFGLCALVLSAAVGAETGALNALVALLLAALPLGIVLPAFLWVDRFEAEPPRLLVFSFAWGALVASSVALVLNTGSLVVLRDLVGGDASLIAVSVAPVVEELAKGMGVLVVLVARRGEFDGVVDGIVYAGVVAAGFAFAENVLYLGRALGEGGSTLAAVFLLRGVIGPFAHPLFTVCIGIGLGVAAATRSAAARVAAPLAGLVVAVALHALWNLSGVTGLRGFFSLYAALQLPVFVGLVGLAAWARAREGRLIGTELAAYRAAGWLSAAEVDMLTSISARRRAVAWAKATQGRPGLHAMRAFLESGSELAFLRARLARGHPVADAAAIERELLGGLVTHRARLMGDVGVRPR